MMEQAIQGKSMMTFLFGLGLADLLHICNLHADLFSLLCVFIV